MVKERFYIDRNFISAYILKLKFSDRDPLAFLCFMTNNLHSFRNHLLSNSSLDSNEHKVKIFEKEDEILYDKIFKNWILKMNEMFSTSQISLLNFLSIHKKHHNGENTFEDFLKTATESFFTARRIVIELLCQSVSLLIKEKSLENKEEGEKFLNAVKSSDLTFILFETLKNLYKYTNSNCETFVLQFIQTEIKCIQIFLLQLGCIKHSFKKKEICVFLELIENCSKNIHLDLEKDFNKFCFCFSLVILNMNWSQNNDLKVMKEKLISVVNTSVYTKDVIKNSLAMIYAKWFDEDKTIREKYIELETSESFMKAIFETFFLNQNFNLMANYILLGRFMKKYLDSRSDKIIEKLKNFDKNKNFFTPLANVLTSLKIKRGNFKLNSLFTKELLHILSFLDKSIKRENDNTLELYKLYFILIEPLIRHSDSENFDFIIKQLDKNELIAMKKILHPENDFYSMKSLIHHNKNKNKNSHSHLNLIFLWQLGRNTNTDIKPFDNEEFVSTATSFLCLAKTVLKKFDKNVSFRRKYKFSLKSAEKIGIVLCELIRSPFAKNNEYKIALIKLLIVLCKLNRNLSYTDYFLIMKHYFFDTAVVEDENDLNLVPVYADFIKSIIYNSENKDLDLMVKITLRIFSGFIKMVDNHKKPEKYFMKSVAKFFEIFSEILCRNFGRVEKREGAIINLCEGIFKEKNFLKKFVVYVGENVLKMGCFEDTETYLLTKDIYGLKAISFLLDFLKNEKLKIMRKEIMEDKKWFESLNRIFFFAILKRENENNVAEKIVEEFDWASKNTKEKFYLVSSYNNINGFLLTKLFSNFEGKGQLTTDYLSLLTKEIKNLGSLQFHCPSSSSLIKLIKTLLLFTSEQFVNENINEELRNGTSFVDLQRAMFRVIKTVLMKRDFKFAEVVYGEVLKESYGLFAKIDFDKKMMERLINGKEINKENVSVARRATKITHILSILMKNNVRICANSAIKRNSFGIPYFFNYLKNVTEVYKRTKNRTKKILANLASAIVEILEQSINKNNIIKICHFDSSIGKKDGLETNSCFGVLISIAAFSLENINDRPLVSSVTLLNKFSNLTLSAVTKAFLLKCRCSDHLRLDLSNKLKQIVSLQCKLSHCDSLFSNNLYPSLIPTLLIAQKFSLSVTVYPIIGHFLSQNQYSEKFSLKYLETTLTLLYTIVKDPFSMILKEHKINVGQYLLSYLSFITKDDFYEKRLSFAINFFTFFYLHLNDFGKRFIVTPEVHMVADKTMQFLVKMGKEKSESGFKGSLKLARSLLQNPSLLTNTNRDSVITFLEFNKLKIKNLFETVLNGQNLNKSQNFINLDDLEHFLTILRVLMSSSQRGFANEVRDEKEEELRGEIRAVFVAVSERIRELLLLPSWSVGMERVFAKWNFADLRKRISVAFKQEKSLKLLRIKRECLGILIVLFEHNLSPAMKEGEQSNEFKPTAKRAKMICFNNGLNPFIYAVALSALVESILSEENKSEQKQFLKSVELFRRLTRNESFELGTGNYLEKIEEYIMDHGKNGKKVK